MKVREVFVVPSEDLLSSSSATRERERDRFGLFLLLKISETLRAFQFMNCKTPNLYCIEPDQPHRISIISLSVPALVGILEHKVSLHAIKFSSR